MKIKMNLWRLTKGRERAQKLPWPSLGPPGDSLNNICCSNLSWARPTVQTGFCKFISRKVKTSQVASSPQKRSASPAKTPKPFHSAISLITELNCNAESPPLHPGSERECCHPTFWARRQLTLSEMGKAFPQLPPGHQASRPSSAPRLGLQCAEKLPVNHSQPLLALVCQPPPHPPGNPERLAGPPV